MLGLVWYKTETLLRREFQGLVPGRPSGQDLQFPQGSWNILQDLISLLSEVVFTHVKRSLKFLWKFCFNIWWLSYDHHELTNDWKLQTKKDACFYLYIALFLLLYMVFRGKLFVFLLQFYHVKHLWNCQDLKFVTPGLKTRWFL